MTEKTATKPQPVSEWGFTGTPDFLRICRDLEAVGATVGLVESKGADPVTLVDGRSLAGTRAPRLRVHYNNVLDTNGRWQVIKGDHVAALLDPPLPPIKVKAFGRATKPEPKAERWGVFLRCDGKRSGDYPGEFSTEAEAMVSIPYYRRPSYFATKL